MMKILCEVKISKSIRKVCNYHEQVTVERKERQVEVQKQIVRVEV